MGHPLIGGRDRNWTGTLIQSKKLDFEPNLDKSEMQTPSCNPRVKLSSALDNSGERRLERMLE
jgi:hypothetical protein